MPLSGQTSDLSLADLVQANIYGRNTCRVLVATPEGHGVFFLSDGAIIDARFGDLEGRDAFCALVNTENAHFRVDSGIRCPARTIHEDWQKLLMDSARLRDENKVPRPQRLAPLNGTRGADPSTPDDRTSETRPVGASADVLPLARPGAPAVRIGPVEPGPGNALRQAAMATPGRQETGAAAGRQRRRGSPLLVLVSILVVSVAAVVYLTVDRRIGEAHQPSQATEFAPFETVEVTALTERGDAPPRLLVGQPPRSPNSALAVAPTVVCRILIDDKGAVLDAKIFRSRLDLASFEDAALEAVRSYRFNPGLRAGRPVRVWVNWPVSFQ